MEYALGGVACIIFCLVLGKLAGIGRTPNSSNDANAEIRTKQSTSEHEHYIGKPYRLQCKSNVFSALELEVLSKYGTWLSALASGKITPETAAQQHFFSTCIKYRNLPFEEMLDFFNNEKEKTDQIQFVWFKYLCRIKFERENTAFLGDETKIDWGWQGPPIESGDYVFFSK